MGPGACVGVGGPGVSAVVEAWMVAVLTGPADGARRGGADGGECDGMEGSGHRGPSYGTRYARVHGGRVSDSDGLTDTPLHPSTG